MQAVEEQLQAFNGEYQGLLQSWIQQCDEINRLKAKEFELKADVAALKTQQCHEQEGRLEVADTFHEFDAFSIAEDIGPSIDWSYDVGLLLLNR